MADSATSHYDNSNVYPCGYHAGQIVVLDGKHLLEVYHQWSVTSYVALQAVGATGNGMKREISPSRLRLPTEAEVTALEQRERDKFRQQEERHQRLLRRLRDTEVDG